ncbi:hypothetical protein [uncultured Aquimarina sp.]|uniref:NADase-type glycan-binding domain-containing protein n=1 Tax=uncultured Aquimarina sp. TaxID=575652 RepID=UPI0026079C33|nr:hypothetical protein [uncultured Aquimarina sp.]
MIKYKVSVIFCLVLSAFTVSAQETDTTLINSVIDSTSLKQIDFFSKEFPSIFEYYQLELKDELSIWSSKMFGSAQRVDMTYAEALSFKFSSNYENKKYPISNLQDFSYMSAYVFKEDQEISIDLTIDKEHNLYSEYDSPMLHPDKVLKTSDTIMFPLQLSLANGYTKSKSLFYKNGRVKKLEVLVNNKTVGYVVLLDTPLIQQFSVHTLFTRDDKITLKPMTFYKGTKYDDICISEIQSCLGGIAHPNINAKYKVRDIEKR